MKKTRVSFLTYGFLCIFLFAAAFTYPKWKKTLSEATLSWDVMGYYLYLPSFFYDDISKLNNVQHILDTYRPDTWPNAYQLPNGNWVMKYSMGMAIMYLPFFAIAQVWASMGSYAIDGFSAPYQTMISFGSIFISMIGLWFTRKNLLRYFSDSVSAIALLILVLATNYFNYVSFVGAMSHNYLFTLYAIVIFITIKWYDRPNLLKSLLIGFFCGLATVTRPTEIIILIIPFIWGIGSWSQIQERINFLWKHRLKVIVAVIGFMVPIIPQLIYWKLMTGQWVYYSYQEQGFSWKHPHVYSGIFTYRNGWLVYTPVMLIALIGFIFLFLRNRSIFWACLLFTMVNIYIVTAWDIWWYGGSFGSRAMIQSYAILLFPLSAFLTWAWNRKAALVVTIPALLFCAWLNLLQTYQGHFRGIFEAENMTRQYYWRIFGKTRIKISDKKLLDMKEEMPSEFEPGLKVIAVRKSPSFDSLRSINSYNGSLLSMLSDSIQSTKDITLPVNCSHEGWFRIYAEVFLVEKDWNVWTMTQFITQLKSGEKKLKQNQFRIQRMIEQGRWEEVFIDIKCEPELHPDSLKIYFDNMKSTKQVYIDNVRVMSTM